MLRKIAQGLALVGVVVGVGALGAGCLDRPITAQAPTIKTNFTSAVNQSGINKVDILFDIDNSASMGDKQTYLIQAIPQMIARLVTPNCVDSMGNPTGQTASSSTGQCPTGSAPEFTAVHDMHIGVVTSSLGSRLGIEQAGMNGAPSTPVCDPNAANVTSDPKGTNPGASVSPHNDDQGHLINRTSPFGSGAAIAQDALSEGGGFLYWFPMLGNVGMTAVAPPAMPYTSSGVGVAGGAPAGTLVGDFSELVGGAGESGCGIESQLESWYRFLIQPDPYASLSSATGKAAWVGVDTTIIQQRHDFLRPDSLVAVIVLTDEDDSEIDVRSYQGSGYLFMSNTYSPPRATTECTSDPNNAGGKCASCAGCASAGCIAKPGSAGCPLATTCSDPNCKLTDAAFAYATDQNDWGYNLNLRHVHMAQKYALNPQFPLTRYYNGLTSTSVPNRIGEYPSATSSYAGNNNCTNPLYAASLPTAADIPAADAAMATPPEVSTTLCTLTAGSIRTKEDVFYAHIGGVPHELLQVNATACTAAKCTGAATDPASCATDCAQKNTLASSDWISILGQGAASYTGAGGTLSYDYTGIDPHMIESMIPRNITTGPACSGTVCVGQIEPTPMSTPPVTSLQGPGLGTGADPVRPDPINGREWTTYTGVHSLPVDRQYACIFQLPTAYTDAQGVMHPSAQRDCAVYQGNSIEGNSCDCDPGSTGTTAWDEGGMPGPTMNTPDEIPPLCSKASTDGSIMSAVNDYTVQTHAKAYPTIRELILANMMGTQGIVSSLCPIHTQDNAAGDDPLYGYRPAVNAIVNRLKNALGSQCVPKLQTTPTACGGGTCETVPCLVLVSFGPTSGGPATQADCATYQKGTYSNPDPTTLQEFQASQKTASMGDAGSGSGSGGSIANEITCALNQVSIPSTQVGTAAGTCVGGTQAGWCYVTGAAISGGSTCSQQISYSATGIVPNGATISLQCISSNQASGDAAAPVATDAHTGG